MPPLRLCILSVRLVLPALLVHTSLTGQATSAASASPRDTRYRAVGGLTMYYQVYGSGRPLLLLHGGGVTIEQTYSQQLPYFAHNHLIIAPEQQGHGRTKDINQPLDYTAMAEATAQLLQDLHLSAVDVIGHSDGGIVGLLLAAHHPTLVRRLAVSGASTLPLGEAFPPSLSSAVTAWDPATDTAGLTRYSASSADSASHYPVFVTKLKDLWLHHPTRDELGPAVLAQVTAPTLVIAGDNDLVLLDHTLALWRALPAAQLLIVPNTTHFTFQQRPEWLNPIVAAFLDDPSLSH